MTTDKALNIIAGMCSKKEYCSKDIREKLLKWEIPEKDIAGIMQFLTHHHFIDDTRYACAYAEDKFRFNHWGKQKITLMLKQKGISAETIQEAIGKLDGHSYEESCKKLLQQKWKTLTEPDPYKLRLKLTRFAAGRGFDFELIQRSIDRLLQEE